MDVDVVVIGAGVIGLAIARKFAEQGQEVIVLEEESSFGMGTSSRNSEVIHAGIYYPEKSLKAKLCVEGRTRLYEYLADRHIDHQRIQKIIVASDSNQVSRLQEIYQQGLSNGVHDLQWLSQEECHELEPNVRAIAGVLSPSTGIVDSHNLMLNLIADVERQGGTLVYRCSVCNIRVEPHEISVEVDQDGGYEIACKTLINAAGLNAVKLAGFCQTKGSFDIPEAKFASGQYFSYSKRNVFNHLVYPIPEPGGLGIHATLDLAGSVKFGPNVIWTDSIEYKFDDSLKSSFVKAISQYYSDIDEKLLTSGYCGIRSKISFNGQVYPDFYFPIQRGSQGSTVVHTLGVESPGLTSCLSIAEYVFGQWANGI